MAVVEATVVLACGVTTFALLTRYARVAHGEDEVVPSFTLLDEAVTEEGAT
jgi:hypothetical protein